MRREAFITHRIVDRAHEDFVTPCQGNRDTPGWKAVHIVARAIEWIDHPSQRRPACRRVGCGLAVRCVLGQRFFADESMIGKGPQHDPANLPLRGEIGLGDEVSGPLVRHAESADPVEEHTAARPGRSLTDGEGIGGYRWLHGGLTRVTFGAAESHKCSESRKNASENV